MDKTHQARSRTPSPSREKSPGTPTLPGPSTTKGRATDRKRETEKAKKTLTDLMGSPSPFSPPSKTKSGTPVGTLTKDLATQKQGARQTWTKTEASKKADRSNGPLIGGMTTAALAATIEHLDNPFSEDVFQSPFADKELNNTNLPEEASSEKEKAGFDEGVPVDRHPGSGADSGQEQAGASGVGEKANSVNVEASDSEKSDDVKERKNPSGTSSGDNARQRRANIQRPRLEKTGVVRNLKSPPPAVFANKFNEVPKSGLGCIWRGTEARFFTDSLDTHAGRLKSTIGKEFAAAFKNSWPGLKEAELPKSLDVYDEDALTKMSGMCRQIFERMLGDPQDPANSAQHAIKRLPADVAKILRDMKQGIQLAQGHPSLGTTTEEISAQKNIALKSTITSAMFLRVALPHIAGGKVPRWTGNEYAIGKAVATLVQYALSDSGIVSSDKNDNKSFGAYAKDQDETKNRERIALMKKVFGPVDILAKQCVSNFMDAL